MACSSLSEAIRRRLGRLCLMLLIFAMIGGCVSPLDPDTPRLRVVADDGSSRENPASWIGAVLHFSANENQQPWLHMVNTMRAEVDTGGGGTLLRFTFAATLSRPYKSGSTFLYSMLIADSLAVDGNRRSLDSDPRGGNGAMFQFAKAKDSSSVTLQELIIFSDPSTGSALLTMTRIPGERAIDGTLVASFTQNQRTQLYASITITW